MPQNSLQQLPIGVTALVVSLEHTDAAMRRRLLDIGFTQNARVTCLYQSPANDPRAYLICDAVIALRKEEAEQIRVKFTGQKRPVSKAFKSSGIFSNHSAPKINRIHMTGLKK